MKCCSILLNKAQKQNPKGSSNLLNVDKCVSITTVKTMIITITPKSLLMAPFPTPPFLPSLYPTPVHSPQANNDLVSSYYRLI